MQYFNQSHWEAGLPSWLNPELMMEEGIILPRNRLWKILQRAEKFLITAPGDNLNVRKKFVPEWLGKWGEILQPEWPWPNEVEKGGFVQTQNILPWKKLGWVVEKENASGMLTGLATMAGGEGHRGHIFFLEQMKKTLGNNGVAVLALEADEYMRSKARKAPFLPLPLRMSMWIYAGYNYVTMMPERPKGLVTDVQIEAFYRSKFGDSRCDYSFATRDEPSPAVASAKAKRGKVDLDTLLPSLTTISTSKLVQQLIDRAIIRDEPEFIREIFPPEYLHEWHEEDVLTVL